MDTKVNYSGMIRRIIAYAVDQHIYYIIYGLLFFFILDKPLYSGLHDIDDIDRVTFNFTTLFSLQDIVIGLLMPVVLEVLMLTKFGQTPGKFICGIRIKHTNTSDNITFIQVVIRSVLKGLLFVPGYFYGWFFILSTLVLIAAIFDKRKQFFYDKIAKTVVINYSSEECNLKSDYVYVGIARRTIACIVDGFIIMGITYLAFFSRVDTTVNPEAFCFEFLPSIIFNIFMIRRFGGTPGQLLCSICIKDINTLKNITFMQATIRYIFVEAIQVMTIVMLVVDEKQLLHNYMNKQLYELLSTAIYLSIVSSLISAVFDKRKQFFYDKIAKTVAIDYKPTN